MTKAKTLKRLLKEYNVPHEENDELQSLDQIFDDAI